MAAGTSTIRISHVPTVEVVCVLPSVTYQVSAMAAVLLATSSLLQHTFSRPVPTLVKKESSSDYTELLHRTRHAACTKKCSWNAQMLFFITQGVGKLTCLQTTQALFSVFRGLNYVFLGSVYNEKRKGNRKAYFQDDIY